MKRAPTLWLLLALALPAAAAGAGPRSLPAAPALPAAVALPASAALPGPLASPTPELPAPPAALPKAAAVPGLPAPAVAPIPSAAATPALAPLRALDARLAAPGRGGSPAAGLEAFWSHDGSAQGSERLAAIVEAARASPTAARVLSRSARLARERGPVPVVFKRLGRNLGAYDYATGELALDAAHSRGDVRQAASVLVHELVHVLQHQAGIPAEALEMEQEAHLVSLKVLDELGVAERERDSFSRAAARALAAGPDDYAAFVAQQLPSKLTLADGADDLIDTLEQDAERWERLAARGGRNAARNAALAARARADADALRTPQGVAAYARFARRVRALIRREAAQRR